METGTESLFDVAASKYHAFIDEYQLYPDVEGFLTRPEDRFASCRSCYLSQCECDICLDYTFDTDGIVVELSRLAGIRFPFRYIHFMPSDNASLLPMYSVLKKHVQCRCNRERDAMKQCRGIQIMAESRWQVVATLINENVVDASDLYAIQYHCFSNPKKHWRKTFLIV